MHSYFKKRAPKWVDHIDKKRDLILGDDIDSLASCCLLQQITGNNWEINKFYDFESIYKALNEKNHRSIGVDMSLTTNGFYCFDNHVNRIISGLPFSNSQMFNVNLMFKQDEYYIARDRYELKYSLSTLLEIWSYYDLNLPESDEGKALILAIDTSFKGYYMDHFHDRYKFWVRDCLEFPQLFRILKRHDAKYFYDLIKKYQLNDKISIDENGELKTNILIDNVSQLLGFDVTLPAKKFKLAKKFERCAHKIGEHHLPDNKDIFSFAYTSKNYESYTKRKGAVSKWEKIDKLIYGKR